MATAQQRTRGSGVRWGLPFGGILAVLLVVSRILIGTPTRFAGIHHRTGLEFLVVSEGGYFVIALALYFVAGYIASRRAHRIEPGIHAGLVAGVLVGLVALAVAVHAATATPHAAIHAERALRLAALTLMLVGTGMGALGGLVGRGRSHCLRPRIRICHSPAFRRRSTRLSAAIRPHRRPLRPTTRQRSTATAHGISVRVP